MPRERIEKDHVLSFLNKKITEWQEGNKTGYLSLKLHFCDGGFSDVYHQEEEKVKKETILEDFSLQTQKIGIRAI